MHDPAIRRDQEQSGTHAVEHVGKGGGFGLLQIDQLTDQHRAPQMRHHQCHAPPHLVIDDALRFAAKDGDERATQCRFFQNDIGRVDPTLRAHPLQKEAALAKFVIWHKFRNTDDLPDFEERQGRDRIESRMRLRIDLHVTRIDAEDIMRRAGFADGVLGQNPAGLAADEFTDPVQAHRPIAWSPPPHRRYGR